MAVWITGANGLIGSHLSRAFASLGQKTLTPPRSELDLADFNKVEAYFRSRTISGIIHCAAISRAADCDSDRPLAKQINVDLTRLLHELGEGIPVCFLSTDLVFDGKKGDYSEEESPAPLNYYGETKAQAEQFILRNPGHTVVRTSLNAGISPSGNRSFNEEMKRQCLAGQTVTLFTDEFRSPIPAPETARLLTSLFQKRCAGVYHLAGKETLSRFEIGMALIDQWRLPSSLALPSSLKDYKGPPRAANTTLCCRKLESALGTEMPSFTHWLKSLEDGRDSI